MKKHRYPAILIPFALVLFMVLAVGTGCENQDDQLTQAMEQDLDALRGEYEELKGDLDDMVEEIDRDETAAEKIDDEMDDWQERYEEFIRDKQERMDDIRDNISEMSDDAADQARKQLNALEQEIQVLRKQADALVN